MRAHRLKAFPDVSQALLCVMPLALLSLLLSSCTTRDCGPAEPYVGSHATAGIRKNPWGVIIDDDYRATLWYVSRGSAISGYWEYWGNGVFAIRCPTSDSQGDTPQSAHARHFFAQSPRRSDSATRSTMLRSFEQDNVYVRLSPEPHLRQPLLGNGPQLLTLREAIDLSHRKAQDP